MSVRILTGDCRDVLAALPDESVHCVVTSPPYWGLRDYGTAKWEGGDPACNHLRFNSYPSGLDGGTEAQDIGKLFKDICGKCGARRIDRQIGLEGSFAGYVEIMRNVFGEVRRVLRKDGTLWLNLGDCYVGGGGCDLAAKNLVGIPWRVAFALQADGWYLRSDIIWSKPNPMPESVTDRPTKAHEYLFLLSKQERYYYDSQSVTEPIAPSQMGRVRDDTIGGASWSERGQHSKGGRFLSGPAETETEAQAGTRNRRSVWEIATSPFPEAHFATFPPALIEPCILAGCQKGGTVLDPFGGAGTTGLVADRLGRNAILIELNPQYAEMAERRLCNDAGMFAQVAAE